VKSDEEKAAFMRITGATHAEWDTYFDDTEATYVERLTKLTLGPVPVAPVTTAGPAQRMADFHKRTASTQQRQHDILFAASSVRPRMNDQTPPNAVPRAVRAKQDAARRGETEE
jgi:hypothetical protein